MRDVDLIALAGLLHDIGKFGQRTGKRDLSDYEETFLKDGRYVHAGHTAKAIEEIGLDSINNLVQIASSHHKNNLYGDEKIIQLADRYASKLDRRDSDEELKRDDFITIGLETPFSLISLDETRPKPYYYKLQKLEGVPKLNEEKRINSTEEYGNLYNEFIEEVKKQNLSFEKDIDFLILKSILEKYTTFIPSSSYKTYPDVSLFDHLLATSAIAVAIKKGDGENFSLIQGDFTSIQSFIFSKYGESNKYLAKILRAKSLFVNIATELISLKIVRELGLNPLSIVMNAGGKFTILAHRLDNEDRKKLSQIRAWVNNEFENINFLQTKFIIKSIEFTKEAFAIGKFKDVFKKMAYEFEKEKLLFIPQKDVFDNYIQRAKKGICDICGIVPIENEKETICKYCQKFKKLGEKLPKAKYINFNLNELLSINISDNKEDEFYFGFNNYPLKHIANYVPKFTQEDLKSNKYELIKEKFNQDDIDIGKIKSFYHIAVDGLKKEGDDWIGKSYLAILKADIDNLGEIFIRGFKENATFSRVLYLSRMIDFFFTNILMDYIKNKNIYTVFAGGDDLFLIGHYEDIVDTYSWILENFKKYTKNDDFHLSAGIRLTRPNVPINLMAEFTEKDLEEAKCLKGKNGVTIFDITLKNSKYQQMLKEKDSFEDILRKLNILGSGTSFLYKLYTFINMKEELKKGENILQNARWKYMLRYLAEKNFEERKSDNENKKRVKKEIKEDLVKIGKIIEEEGEKLKIPLNLFLYSIRK